MTNTGNKGYLRASGNKWGDPNTTVVKFKLGGTYSVKGFYYKQGHTWGDYKENLPRYWKIKVGNTKVKNANGGDVWALPQTNDEQYILFDPNKNYSGSSVTFYDIHHGTSGLISFQASFFIKDTSKYSVWKNTSVNCTTSVHQPSNCSLSSWRHTSTDSCPGSGKYGGNACGKGKKKKHYERTRTAAKHGGKDNCSTSLKKHDNINCDTGRSCCPRSGGYGAWCTCGCDCKGGVCAHDNNCIHPTARNWGGAWCSQHYHCTQGLCWKGGAKCESAGWGYAKGKVV